jgi:hypothetical protein
MNATQTSRITSFVLYISTSVIFVHNEGCVDINMMIHAERNDAHAVTFEL